MAERNRSLSTYARNPLSLFEEGWGTLTDFFGQTGLSISEDDQNIYVDAQLPGLKREDIQVKLEENLLWIKGEKKEEKSDKRYFQKAASSFSYRLSLPQTADLSQEPSAEYENGELRITFKKAEPNRKTKEIQIKNKK